MEQIDGRQAEPSSPGKIADPAEIAIAQLLQEISVHRINLPLVVEGSGVSRQHAVQVVISQDPKYALRRGYIIVVREKRPADQGIPAPAFLDAGHRAAS